MVFVMEVSWSKVVFLLLVLCCINLVSSDPEPQSLQRKTVNRETSVGNISYQNSRVAATGSGYTRQRGRGSRGRKNRRRKNRKNRRKKPRPTLPPIKEGSYFNRGNPDDQGHGLFQWRGQGGGGSGYYYNYSSYSNQSSVSGGGSGVVTSRFQTSTEYSTGSSLPPYIEPGIHEIETGTVGPDRTENTHPLYHVEYEFSSQDQEGRGRYGYESGARYPDTGNLLLGREHNLTASSTCGLHRKEKYCIVSHLTDRKKCFMCHTVPHVSRELSHPIDNIVSKNRHEWWQAQNGIEDVYIQLNLEAEFHFTHLVITFKTFRPAAMLIERSFDFGKTWMVYRYFAHNCAESFPGIPNRNPINITDVVCEDRYSDVAPSSGGEIIFRVLPPYMKVRDPYSDEVQSLLRMTNLRLNFTKLHTLGDDLLDNRNEIKEKYYYSIYHMIVRGSCSCYGHAERCVPLPGVPVGRAQDMVHGRCECTHYTTGLNCEKCEDFYNDLPWKPAVGKHTNACKKCNCNEHATSCHFDPEEYEKSGKLSGGVCDDCLHNTMGNNCEKCIPYYYQDPHKSPTHAQTCLPCGCDLSGTVDDGLCDSLTDDNNGLAAGQCHCKKNIGGRRCDRCKVGFWNFDTANPDGCQTCTCNTLGTIDNQGCDVVSGECRCKAFVRGRDCNDCLPEHWGLSEDHDGCKPCDCDPGGAFNNNCNKTSGQCSCRDHAIGRRCDQTDQGYFAGLLNHLVYEAEEIDSLERCGEEQGCRVITRGPYPDGRAPYWTGPGFVQVRENSYLNFTVDNITSTLDYDVVLRYEPQHAGNWVDVRVVVDRDGPVDPSGSCTNNNDYKQIQLPYESRYAIASSTACLEAGKQYKVRVEFRRYEGDAPPAHASILIDSLALVPHFDSLPLYKSERDKEEFSYYRCGEAYYEVVQTSNMADICKRFYHSIGFYVFKKGDECKCDLTGSTSAICDSLDGQCQCKTNVYGRKCDKCAPGTYGFGPVGCTYCECDGTGSLHNLCNEGTGQCECLENTYGLTCNQCQPSFWNFPNCIRCECNGHADTCDSRTGECNDCRGNTAGANCDRCKKGFYGDPRLGVGLACKPCPCPGTAADNHSFADGCYLDERTQNVICECKRGYRGARCDVCSDNYFGNPEEPGGKCEPCQCNNNIVPERPNNCNATTGECLECEFDTAGFHCERCANGFFGDAIGKQCRKCQCSPLGTDNSTGFCDHETGECHCLPNVIGSNCGSCAENHWKIATGSGCVPCDCDQYGSLSTQCHPFYGICECKSGFGGAKCDQCRENHWGDPRRECHPCDCDPSGSANRNCHQNNGTCECLPGVGGDKCDQCARGFLGYSPNCQPCGECFDNWDAILTDLREQTQKLVDAAEDVKQTGATGAYTKEFQSMEKKLGEIKSILRNATVSNEDLNALKEEVQHLREILKNVLNDLDTVNDEVDNTTQRIYIAKVQLTSLEEDLVDLTKQVATLKENATSLQEAHLGGALNITRDALERSVAAENRARNTKYTLENSKRQRQRTETLLNDAEQLHNQYHRDIKQQLTQISEKIAHISSQIPQLNDDVCDNRGDPCDQFCGGAGCGKCGGLGCDDGAFTKATTALKMAEDARDILEKSQTDAEKRLRAVTRAKSSAVEAHSLAEVAHTLAQEADNVSRSIKLNLEDLIDKINDFLVPDRSGANPAEIRILAEEILEKKISLQPHQITTLARQINGTISSLTNIDAILRDTQEDLRTANQLKQRADQAREDAIKVLDTATRVVKALEDAGTAQESAIDAIKQATTDVGAARVDLVQISSETKAAGEKVNSTMSDIESMRTRITTLREKFISNDHAVKTAESEATIALNVAHKATEKADELEDAYNQVSSDLEQRSNVAADARARANALQQRANKLAAEASIKLEELKQMESEYIQHEETLQDLSTDLATLNTKMTSYLKVISSKAEHYRTCHR